MGDAQKEGELRFGVKDTDVKYVSLTNAVSMKSSISNCYYFEEHRDLGFGRALVPDELWTDLPPLIQQYMDEEVPGGLGIGGYLSDDEVWDEMNRDSPVKAHKAAKKAKSKAKAKGNKKRARGHGSDSD